MALHLNRQLFSRLASVPLVQTDIEETSRLTVTVVVRNAIFFFCWKAILFILW